MTGEPYLLITMKNGEEIIIELKKDSCLCAFLSAYKKVMVKNMSEKRFRVRFEQEDGRGEIVNEKGVELTARKVMDLLNALHEENEQLRKERDYWKAKYDEGCETFEAKLVEENEQLKQKLKEQEKLCDLRVQSVRGIYDE